MVSKYQTEVTLVSNRSALYNPKRIQKLMGHSSTEVTMGTYGHLMPDDDDIAVVSLNDLVCSGHNLDTISQK